MELIISTYRVRVLTVNNSSNILLPIDPSTPKYQNKIRIYFVCDAKNATRKKNKK